MLIVRSLNIFYQTQKLTHLKLYWDRSEVFFFKLAFAQ